VRQAARLQRPARAPATHLYETLGKTIVAYPLNKDGLPETTPDWQLTGGLSNGRWLGFDGAGYIYVSDPNLNQVRIYAPGASGNAQPVSVIPVPGSCAMAVNKAGYIFVTAFLDGNGCGASVAVYAPVIGLPSTWVPQPIHTITTNANPYLEDLVVDEEGRLYIATATQIWVFDDPVNDWQTPSRIVRQASYESYIAAPIAIQSGTGFLYFATLRYSDRFTRWSPADFGMRSFANTLPDVVTLTKQCREPGTHQEGGEKSLAVNQQYIMFTCQSIARSPFIHEGSQ
jgi:hypothetical protein